MSGVSRFSQAEVTQALAKVRAACLALPETSERQSQTDPDRFFRPPYVGHLGWLGVLLPGIDDIELAAICQEAFTTVAPPSVLKMLATD